MANTVMLAVLALGAAVSGASALQDASLTPAAAADRITSLPGLAAALPFDMFSGYITVDESHGRALFYWFVESANEPSTDPILIWLQGGPGCSSLIGFLMENGALLPLMDGGVKPNPYSWNRFANTLYIESPAGVGFSYSNTTSDYNTNNAKTAADTYTFVKLWLERFPQFQSNKLWVAGESYGGDYVPDLVQKILAGGGAVKSQLEGFIIGNPVLSCPAWEATMNTIQVNLFYWHGLIPYSAYTEWMSSDCATPNPQPTKECVALLNTITDMIGPFDSDNLYTDLISGNATLGVGPTPPHSVQDLMNTYLNRTDVQQAIHARPTSWVACCAERGQSGTQCALNYTTSFPDMMPFYEQFFKDSPNLRILIYSGDTDIATCPHPYAQLCLSSLNRPQLQPWTRWVMDEQTAGYSEVYDRYTYATVKGAGHEVPFFQPREAFHLVSNFIAGQFPSGHSNTEL